MNYRGWFGAKYVSHMHASAVRKRLNGFWERAYTFAVDRHPYDKVLSQSAFRLGRQGSYTPDDLIQEIDNLLATDRYLNYPLYTYNGSVIVDQVVRYEELWDHLKSLAERTGNPFPHTLPMAKGQFRNDFVTRELLTPQQKRDIQKGAEFEFSLLGWDA